MTRSIPRWLAPLGGAVERWGRWLRGRTGLRRLAASALGQRLTWFLIARLDGYQPVRRAAYPAGASPGLLSLLTPAWNTDPGQLQALADSIFAQADAPPFEWLIHDNGSSDPRTRAALDALARHPAVKLERAAHNLGITGGLRRCLERARGRYVLPIDHDDTLYPDALRIVAWHLAHHDNPPLLYTDEDKLYGTRHCRPFFKPDWDPVLFVNQCYTAHLAVLDRARALALGVWSDATYDGCPDWDCVMRFWQAGDRPRHLPEVLYGWRMHAGSTGGVAGAKGFVAASQQALLERFIAGRPHPERYAVEPNPLFPDMPSWRIRRRTGAPRPIATIVLGDPASPTVAAWRAGSRYPAQRWQALAPDAPLAQLADLAREAERAGALVRLLSDAVAPLAPVDDAAALWEAVGLFELFADTAMVGGRIVDAAGRVCAAGGYFGHGAGDGPDAGRRLDEPGYQARLWLRRSVGWVSSALAVVAPDCLIATATAPTATPPALDRLGAWCGAAARRAGQRVVYTPFLAGRATRWDAPGARERAAFRAQHGDLMLDDPLWSPHLERAGA
jgi:hypothetical protein